MYPNSALSAGQMALVAVVAVLSLAIWLTAVFVAARDPRRREGAAQATSLPQRESETQEPHGKAA